MKAMTASRLTKLLAMACLSAASPLALASAYAIGDFVWEDLNRNGLQDEGEPGIAGVTVMLGGDCHGLTHSDAGGHYLMSLFGGGTRCYLDFLPPALSHARYQPTVSGAWMGFTTGYYDELRQRYMPMAGNDSDIDYRFYGVNATPMFTRPLEDTEGGDEWATKVDAGFVRWINGGIGGRVWNDANRNGQQDAWEHGLVGVKVDLMVSLIQVGASVTTDATGRFSFDDLQSDWNYLLRVQVPTGWALTGADVGNDLRDNDFTAAGYGGVANALIFRLDSAEQRSSIGAGLYDPAAAPVPEPATWALWLAGALGLAAAGWRRGAVAGTRVVR